LRASLAVNALSQHTPPLVWTCTRSGTGIGLSIVRAIAEAHGGTAVIVDTPSGGATVQLSVPVDDSHLNLMNRGQD